MSAVLTTPQAGFAKVLQAGEAAWLECAAQLASQGVRLPLPHYPGWTLARPRVQSLLVALRASNGSWAGAVGVQASLSRALPGFRILRVERFGEAVPRAQWRAAVDALAGVAHRGPRTLRLTVEVFSRDAETRAGLADLLARTGFVRAPEVRNWRTTLAIDLEPSEEQLLASFAPLVRRALRTTAKLPLQVRLIDDPRLGTRLETLSRETLARTGGRYQALWSWPGMIELSQRRPNAARLVGLFRTDRDGPDALLGFAWAYWNGQSVSYVAGGSTRPTDLRGASIGHPMMWDLIRWAKREGAVWFDLGGVTPGRLGSTDPLGGISDFKRLFSKHVTDVAEDWVLEPHAVPARLAAVVSKGAAWLSRAVPSRVDRTAGETRTTSPAECPAGTWSAAAALGPRHLPARLVASDLLAPALRQLGRGLASIFTVHRFTDPDHGVLGHDPTALRGHLAYLRRHGYRLLSLTDVLTLLENGGSGSGPPAVAFTVDDAYGDFARIGAPIFAEYDCPVTMFIPTGFVDGQLWLWWDRVTHLFQQTRRCSVQLRLHSGEHAYRWSTQDERACALQDVLDRLEQVDVPVRETAIAELCVQLDGELPASPPPAFAPMTWNDVGRLAKQGVTFGPHTVTHPILTLASLERCEWEIGESFRRLREQTDASISVFCYPAGKARERELDAARRAGFRAAVTTIPGYAAPHGVPAWGPLSRFGLPRFPYPDDRQHFVNIASGLARWRRRIRRPRPLAPATLPADSLVLAVFASATLE